MGRCDEGGGGGEQAPLHAGRSVVLPYRGGVDESRIFGNFVRSVMNSGVDELVVGIDRDAGEYPEIAKALCEHGGRLRAVTVLSSGEWGFRFAEVLWHLIGAARHDLVLVTNVDEMPSADALGPPHKAGAVEGYVLESGPDARWGKSALPKWTGTFWVWRPALGSYFDLGLYRLIRDGGDSFFFWSAVRKGLRYHVRQGPWIETRGDNHMDLGWYRWKNGFRDSATAQGTWGKIALHRRLARNLAAVRGLPWADDMWYAAGWILAMIRPNSYWAAQARELDDADWIHQGRKPYDDIWRRWWRRKKSGGAVVVHGYRCDVAS